MNSVVVHYQEIALKGRNRPWFIARLVRNIRTATADLDVSRVVTKMGRIEIMLGAPEAWAPVADRLRHVFGIANFSRAALVPLDVDGIAAAILDDLGDLRVSTFRVSAKRADKRFPLTSPQIEREVGGRIKEATGWTVNLENPELTIHVEALTGEAFYYFGKEAGPGGMPTGVSGRVVALLSGGIDSPVALPADEARLPRHPGALSQLSDPVPCIAGESARACGGADAVSAVHAPVHGCVRRDSAAGDAGRAAAIARGDLPAPDAADCQGIARAGPCRRAGDRRSDRSGRVADAREHGDDRIGVDAAGVPAADRHGQGRDYGGGAAARAHFRSRSSRIRTAASCSRPSIPRPKHGAATSTRRNGHCRSTILCVRPSNRPS